MEYKTVRQLENLAEVTPEGRAPSRTQRLERWAELLERDPPAPKKRPAHAPARVMG